MNSHSGKGGKGGKEPKGGVRRRKKRRELISFFFADFFYFQDYPIYAYSSNVTLSTFTSSNSTYTAHLTNSSLLASNASFRDISGIKAINSQVELISSSFTLPDLPKAQALYAFGATIQMTSISIFAFPANSAYANPLVYLEDSSGNFQNCETLIPSFSPALPYSPLGFVFTQSSAFLENVTISNAYSNRGGKAVL